MKGSRELGRLEELSDLVGVSCVVNERRGKCLILQCYPSKAVGDSFSQN